MSQAGSFDNFLRGGVPNSLRARHAAAVGLLADGRIQEALRELHVIVNDCRDSLGQHHPDTIIGEGNLAVAYVMSDQGEEGARLMVENLSARAEIFGDEHPRTLTARDALAATYRLIGRLDDALWLYSHVAPQRNRVLGPFHSETLTTRLGLGLTLAQAGDKEMAIDLIDAALRDSEAHNGSRHPHTVTLRYHLHRLQGERSDDADDTPTRDLPTPVQSTTRNSASDDVVGARRN